MKKSEMSLRLALLGLLAGLGSSPAQDAPQLVPAESLVAPEGMEVTVWATTPMLQNPTNMDVDHLGRIWVAQGVNYRMFRNDDVMQEDNQGDKIVVLTDTDNDGKADKSHVFVQEPDLVAPLGVAVIDNRVVVSQPPSIIVYTDVDRNAVFDPKVDQREIFLQGFGGRDHDHSLHSVTTGPNGQWYFNVGNAGTHIVEDRDGWTLRAGSGYKGGSPSVTEPGPNQGGRPGLKSDDGHVYVGSVALRVNPDGTGLRPIGHNMRNSYEQTVTSFGDVFQNDNDDPPACRTTWLMEYGNLGYATDDGTRKWQAERRPGQSSAIGEWRQEDPGTIPAGDVYGKGSPSGIAFYEHGALGAKHKNMLLSCETLLNTVYGYQPKPDGAGFKLERFDFLRSKRADEFAKDGEAKAEQATWFRPSDVVVGPDGAIYVADWFDARVGGHRMSDVKGAGTIYRVAPKGRKLRAPKLNLKTMPGQITALKNPANNVRNLGFTRLKAAGEQAVPAVKELLKSPNQNFQARAIWLLAQLGDKGIAEVESILAKARNPQIRVVAFRALRFVESNVLKHAAALAKDPSPAVRREVGLALRDVPLAKCEAIIVELARRYDGKDRWYLEALGTACAKKEAAIYPVLLREFGHADGRRWDVRFAGIAWRLHPAASVAGFKARAIDSSLPYADRRAAMTAIAFVPRKEAALAMVEVAEKGTEPVRKLAAWWLYNRSQNDWSDHKGLMKGLNRKPNALKMDQDYLVPIDQEESTKPDVKEILALKGDVARGEVAIALCHMCHVVDGKGVDFGPNLTGWGRGNSREVIAHAIVHPDKDIAHGFEATELVTKQGHRMQGFILTSGGTYTLKVFGGGEVVVPRKLLRSEKPMKRSLMLSAGQFGLTDQSVADIIAYMKRTAAPVGKKSASAKPVSTPTKAKKKILFIAGNTKHRHGYHEYRAGSILLANALNESGLPIEAKVHWYGWPEDESIFDGVDACIIYADSGGQFGGKYAFLDRKVKAGMGIMFMHYGVHPTKEVGETYYKKWIGGYFDDTFSVNPSWVADLVPKSGHPIARGLNSTFKTFDELYWNLNIQSGNPQVYPLVTAIPNRQNMVRYGSSKFWNRIAARKLGTEQSLVWCRDPENGARGAGFVGGHYHRNWAIDDYRKMILNTIAWVARIEVPKAGVPSKTITKAMLNENLNRPDHSEQIELPTPDLLAQPPGKTPELGPNGRAVQKRRKQ